MEKNQEIYENLYAPKDVVKMTNIEKETLRKYTEFFNIQTEWTQPNKRGHRRYTQENVDTLRKIKEKIHDQNWSWKQTLGWLNGDEEFFVNREEKSRLEKKMDELLEQQQKQEQFNSVLAKKLDEISQENNELKTFLDEKIEKRDQQLLEVMNQKQEENQEKNQSFFKRMLSSFRRNFSK